MQYSLDFQLSRRSFRVCREPRLGKADGVTGDASNEQLARKLHVLEVWFLHNLPENEQSFVNKRDFFALKTKNCGELWWNVGEND